MPKRRRKPRNADASDVNEEDNVVLRETAPLQLRYYGDPVLRQRAKPVSEITEAERQLAEQMLINAGSYRQRYWARRNASRYFEASHHRRHR